VVAKRWIAELGAKRMHVLSHKRRRLIQLSNGAVLSNPGEFELAGEDRKFTASLLEAAQVPSVFAREVNGFGGRHDVEDPGRGVDAHDDSAGCIYRVSS
jgi:hypothetical protein